jgi:hypothetical protein
MTIRWIATLYIPSGSTLCCVYYVLQTKCNFVRFEVFTAVTMKNAVSWDVALYSSCVN